MPGEERENEPSSRRRKRPGCLTAVASLLVLLIAALVLYIGPDWGLSQSRTRFTCDGNSHSVPHHYYHPRH